jgi:hypothetical protein
VGGHADCRAGALELLFRRGQASEVWSKSRIVYHAAS